MSLWEGLEEPPLNLLLHLSFPLCERSESGRNVPVQHLLVSDGDQCGDNLERIRHDVNGIYTMGHYMIENIVIS